jgi:tRNA-(ms[2]io[6]A)-hydroxylase
MDTVLLDHAHCEKKAASTAVGLLFRYPEEPGLAEPLSRVAREELEHFERVLSALAERGLSFRRLRPSPYAQRLSEGISRDEPLRLLDTLIVCALIEARSCERMGMLAEALPEGSLRSLYAGLLESEARHHALYLDLARGTGRFPEALLRERLEALAEHEAHVLADLPLDPRFHNR